MMSTYIKCLISTMLIGSLVLLLVPESDGHIKKYLSYACGLAMLLTMVTPLLKESTNMDTLSAYMTSFFQQSIATDETSTGSVEDAIIQGKVRETAYAIISYLSDEYRISSDRISVTVVTNEQEKAKIEEIQIYIHNSTASGRIQIQNDIQKMTGVTVYVFEKAKSND